MISSAPPWIGIALLALTLSAAIIDARRGLIPNWLTLPALAAVLLARGVVQGPGALGLSVLGACVCGLIPLLLFGLRAIGGGDVKLLAAIGALTGIRLGLEIQLVGFMLCMLYGLGLLAFRGELLATLRRSLALLAAPLVPKARRRMPAEAAMTSVRLGPAIFLAAATSVARGVLGG
jgi:prepilin peptidase CpaA